MNSGTKLWWLLQPPLSVNRWCNRRHDWCLCRVYCVCRVRVDSHSFSRWHIRIGCW
ncbi:hypothetical protein Hanom_Chr12g01181291 [Helianthus anomalus]